MKNEERKEDRKNEEPKQRKIKSKKANLNHCKDEERKEEEEEKTFRGVRIRFIFPFVSRK